MFPKIAGERNGGKKEQMLSLPNVICTCFPASEPKVLWEEKMCSGRTVKITEKENG